MTLPVLIAVVLLAYLLGAVPFGYLIARMRGVDILRQGSGNIGATNAARVIGFRWFPVVLALDALKGFGPTALAGLLNDRGILGYSASLDYVIVAAVGAMLGHTFSPYLKFKGGKGVATGLGVMLAITGTPGSVIPLPALCAFGVFLLALIPTRMMSAASIVGHRNNTYPCPRHRISGHHRQPPIYVRLGRKYGGNSQSNLA
jgi:glycerol-3-phosphate acyltransferase PlsY